MDKAIGVVIVILIILGCVWLFGDDEETVTTYYDSNMNGECDRGEALYYEDSEGKHWID